MKKLCILIFMALPLFGLVWSEDPSLTEEQKEERREINKQIAENNMREIQKEKQRWIREQIEKDSEQGKKGVDPIIWGPSANDEGSEDTIQEDSD